MRKPRPQQRRPWQQRSFSIISYSPQRNDFREEFLTNPGPAIRRFDKNGDKLLSMDELKGTPAARIFAQLLKLGDANKDQKAQRR